MTNLLMSSKKTALAAVAIFCAFSGYAELRETVMTPTRIVWISPCGQISNEQVLLEPFSGQVSVNNSANCMTMASEEGSAPASILLDFGKEIYGGLKIYSGMPQSKKSKHIRVCFGESVTEAMSSVDTDSIQNPTNEHSLRDYDVYVPWLGSVECGKSGFRFARIDMLDTDEPLQLRYVEGRCFMRDDPEVGSFTCSDPRLNDIWNTGAYTVKLNMQDYVWDGIKRDRLVWLGDMHPEVMTISSVWGNMPVVQKTLDYAVADTPLPGWMNNMCTYSIWWLLIQRDLYMYQGDLDYLRSNQDYIAGLTAQIAGLVDDKGREHLDGTRFLDWPTSEDEEIINSGLHSLTYMAMEAAAEIGDFLGDDRITEPARAALKRMAKVKAPSLANKQAAALAIVSGRTKNARKDLTTIEEGGPDGFSTFYGYYMLEAMAAMGHSTQALDIMKKYWGAMLDLGATTFWEDLKYSDVANAAPIDEFVPEGKYDIHSGGGDYCYKGLRLSLCHGWASGPTAWLTRHVLGIRPLAPGCERIEVNPDLGDLAWAKGTFPTPMGVVSVEVVKGIDGKPVTNVTAPEGVEVVNRAWSDALTLQP